MENLSFAKAAPVATRAPRDQAAGRTPLPSRATHVDSGASSARGGSNEQGTSAGTLGHALGRFIEVFDMLDTDVFGSGGAGVHENEPSAINDGGLALHLRGGCGATQQNEEEEEEEEEALPALVPIVDSVQRPEDAEALPMIDGKSLTIGRGDNVMLNLVDETRPSESIDATVSSLRGTTSAAKSSRALEVFGGSLHDE